MSIRNIKDMKTIRTVKILTLFSFILLLATSCSSTKVLSSWSLNPPPVGAMDKVLVLGVMQNMQQKDEVEQAMVNQLNRSEVNAGTATSLFGPKGFRGMSEEQITDKLRGSNFTSVMIVSLVDKEKEKNYVRGMRYSAPRVVGYSRYYRRYIVVYDQIYTPGYYATNTNYVLEADIYTVNDDDQLVYSAQTRSYDPRNARALGESFAKAIVDELKTKGIIK